MKFKGLCDLSSLEALYESLLKCPVCDQNIKATKIRTKAVKLEKQDTDFCPWYQGENPLFYEPIICPECGFASHITSIESITKHQRAAIRQSITPKWVKRSYSGQRTIKQAIDAYKLVLLNLHTMGGSCSETAKILIRLAWLHRYKGESEHEMRYMKLACDFYQKAYAQEDLSLGKMDEYTCMFIIAELLRRTGSSQESLQWFSKLITLNANPKYRDSIPKRLIKSTNDIVSEMRAEKNNLDKDLNEAIS